MRKEKGEEKEEDGEKLRIDEGKMMRIKRSRVRWNKMWRKKRRR
jgi:hypothetical protein